MGSSDHQSLAVRLLSRGNSRCQSGAVWTALSVDFMLAGPTPSTPLNEHVGFYMRGGGPAVIVWR